MKCICVAVVIVLAMVQLLAEPGQALTCGQVDASLAPCITYLTQGGQPTAACCSGVKTLKGLAATTDEKKTACNCAKAAANRYPNLKDDAAQSLASKCGVSLDIPVSRTVNCDTISFKPERAITCGQVDAFLAPCIPYLTQGGQPATACCSGVKNLKGMATSTDEKRLACNCVKAAANRYANLKDDAAQSLASKCGVSLDIPVSRTVNCDTISGQRGITCGQVDASLAPCIPYLTQGGQPAAACCSGVQNLKGMATSTDQKRTACNCVKAAANRYSNLKDDAAQSLAFKCGVSLDIPVSRTVNCDTISGQRGITCGQVDASLAPCIPYLTQGGQPAAACCSGVQNLKGMATSTAEKRTACNCVKAAANRYANLKDDAAQSLASKCGVSLDIPVSRTVNCDAISY